MTILPFMASKPFLLLPLLFCLALSAFNPTCYYPNGTVAKDAVSCWPGAYEPVYMCCKPGSVCLDSKICADQVSKDMMKYYRGTCSDQDWRSDICPQFCNVGDRNLGAMPGIAYCGNVGDKLGWECEGDASEDDDARREGCAPPDYIVTGSMKPYATAGVYPESVLNPKNPAEEHTAGEESKTSSANQAPTTTAASEPKTSQSTSKSQRAVTSTVKTETETVVVTPTTTVLVTVTPTVSESVVSETETTTISTTTTTSIAATNTNAIETTATPATETTDPSPIATTAGQDAATSPTAAPSSASQEYHALAVPIGVGVGVGTTVVLAAGALGFFYYLRKKRGGRGLGLARAESPPPMHDDLFAVPDHRVPTIPRIYHEVKTPEPGGTMRFELV